MLKGKICDDEEETRESKDYKELSENKQINNDFKLNSNIFEDNNINASGSVLTPQIKSTIVPPKLKANKPNFKNITEQSQITQNKPQTLIAPPSIKKELSGTQHINNNPISNQNPFNQNNINNCTPSSNKPNVINNPFLASKKEPTTQQTHNIRHPPRINMANRYASIFDQNK